MDDEYPVAAELVKIDFLLGFSLRDWVEAMGAPAAGFLIIGSPQVEARFGLYLSLIGAVIGGAILYLKEDSQYPHDYVIYTLDYYLTSNTYFNRRHEKHKKGKIKDVYISQIEGYTPPDQPLESSDGSGGPTERAPQRDSAGSQRPHSHSGSKSRDTDHQRG